MGFEVRLRVLVLWSDWTNGERTAREGEGSAHLSPFCGRVDRWCRRHPLSPSGLDVQDLLSWSARFSNEADQRGLFLNRPSATRES